MQVHIRIYGEVQGVFFRSSAKAEANRAGLVGWVRNRQDGSVEVMAQGPKASLKQFVAWCKEGPPLALVEGVETDWVDKEQSFESFDIL